MHTSINTHVSYNFYDQATNTVAPNLNMFYHVVGKFPDRLKNLFFIYAVVLRAVNRLAPTLENYDYNTGIN